MDKKMNSKKPKEGPAKIVFKSQGLLDHGQKLCHSF